MSLTISSPSPLNFLQISKSSNVNSDPNTILTFLFSQLSPLPAGFMIIVTVPQIFRLESVANVMCTNAEALNLACTVATANNGYVFSMIYPSSVSSSESISLSIGSFINMPSFQPLS